MWRSEPQTPLASTRTIASSGARQLGLGRRRRPAPRRGPGRSPLASARTLGSSRSISTRPTHSRRRAMSEDPGAVLITGCSSGHRPRDRRAGWPRRAGPSTRPPAGPSRSPTSPRPGCETLALDVTDEASMRAAVAAVEARARRGRGAGQQRRLQPVGRARDAADGEAAGAVRDQRLRARAHVPAGAAEDARGGPRADRQHQLDGRQAHLPRRRRLPRDQVRGRGALRRAALRGRGLRGPGRRSSSRA